MTDSSRFSLGASGERLRALIERRGEATFLYRLDDPPRFEYLSPAFAEWSGYPLAALTANDRLLIDRIHPEDQATVLSLESWTESDSFAFRWLAPDGRTLWLEASAIPVEVDGKLVGIQGVLRNVTGLRSAEEARLSEQARLYSVLDSLPGFVHLQARDYTMPFANRHFQDLLGPVDGKTCYELVEGREAPCEDCPRIEVFRTGKTITREWHAPNGRTYQIHDMPFTDVDGTPLVLALGIDVTKRKAAEEEVERSHELIRLLAEHVRDFIYRFRFWPTEGYEYVSPGVTALTGYLPEELYADPDFMFKRVHPDDQHLITAHRRRPEDLARPFVFRWRRKDGTYVWMEGQNVPVYDEEGRFVAVEGIGRDITERKEAEEALQRARDELESRVIERTAELSEANLRLRQEIYERTQAKQLSDALNRINMIINSTLDAKEIQRRVVAQSAESVGADVAALIIRDGHRWEAGYVHDDQGVLSAELKRQMDSIWREAARTRSPVVIHDCRADARIQPSVAAEAGIRSVVATPITVRREVRGVIAFHFHRPLGGISENLLDFAQKLSASVSLALENAELYQTEHIIADTLQDALLLMPMRVRGVEFAHLYRSATRRAKIGGDFYDLFRIDDSRIGIIIGDVCGKGIQAASVATMLKNTLRAFAYQADPPAEALSKTNEIACRSFHEATFATVFLVILDQQSGALTYCGAGHPPGVLRRADGALERLHSNFQVVGALPEVPFTEGRAHLSRGDVLLLYTDGATEARRGREFFGEERLLEVVAGPNGASVKELPDRLYAKIVQFSGGSLPDDIAILALAWNQSSRPRGCPSSAQ